MIPGLEIDQTIEGLVWAGFASWAEHFRRDLLVSGVRGLLERYRELVESVERRSCTHGPNGTRLAGQAWRSCCGVSYEYQNDLSVRDALAIIQATVPNTAFQPYENDLVALDVRLHLNYPPGALRTGEWWRATLPLCIVA